MYNICMKRINLYLTEKQITSLTILSEDGLSLSEHIRIAINKYLHKKEKNIYSESYSKKGGN